MARPQDPAPDAADSVAMLENLASAPKAEQFRAVATRLASESLRDVAWGAWFAAELELREAIPDLRTALRRVADPTSRELGSGRASTDPRLVRQLIAPSLLDALIRTRADDVSAAELAPFLDRRTHDAAFVLLARRPGRNAATLLDLLETHATAERRREVVFIACGNLLATVPRPTGFAAWLLANTEIRLTLSVHDGDPILANGSCGGSYSGRASAGTRTVPRGFPPVVHYDLEIARDAGAGRFVEAWPAPQRVLVADGATRVVAERQVHETRGFGIGSRSRRTRPERYVDAWLPELAGLDDVGFRRTMTQAIDVRDVDYRLAATAAVDEVATAWDRLVAALLEQGYLSAAEAATATRSLDLEILIQDQRRDRTVVLTKPVVRR